LAVGRNKTGFPAMSKILHARADLYAREVYVFVLTGSHSRESTTVLGVYGTRMRAEKQRKLHQSDRALSYDYYGIDRCVLE
jgi:hypothetical protein